MSCKFLGCVAENPHYYSSYCTFHYGGGFIGNGKTFKQYQIIEEDFISFIRIVPLSFENLTVNSPVLRDIILRCCVQIEIFFKQWALQHCSELKEEDKLMRKYNYKGKGSRNWNIGDYFFLETTLF